MHLRDRMTEKPALIRWQRRIDQYREQLARRGPPIWEKEQGWYDRWVDCNDFHHQTLPYLTAHLSRGDKVLEIGPGTGAFTLPLAEAGADIVGLEPSGNMRDSLQAKLKERGLSSVVLLPISVEESLDTIHRRGPFQHTLASFSLYNVREIDRVLETLLACSEQIFILMGTGASCPWYRALYEQFAVEEPISAPQLDFLYPLLLEMRILADVHIVWSSHNSLYDDQESMLDWWQEKIELPRTCRAELDRVLQDYATHRNGQLGIYRKRPHALVVIEQRKQIHTVKNDCKTQHDPPSSQRRSYV